MTWAENIAINFFRYFMWTSKYVGFADNGSSYLVQQDEIGSKSRVNIYRRISVKAPVLNYLPEHKESPLIRRMPELPNLPRLPATPSYE